MEIKMKRVYEPAEEDDGFRVLADRLWPRGLKKEDAEVDLWLKEIAPSNELRKWYQHKPELFDEFSARYKMELNQKEALEKLRKLKDENPLVTLLTATKETKLNHLTVIKDMLQSVR
jgi:uncharacterized protein YeaO (DUF488 family)